MGIVRRIGAAVLLVAAIAVYFGLAPDDGASGGAAGERSGIESEDDFNNELAEGAPQQAVVNGWTTNEYLSLLSEQIEDAASGPQRDERPAALLLLAVAGIALIALTAEPALKSPGTGQPPIGPPSGPLQMGVPAARVAPAQGQPTGGTPPPGRPGPPVRPDNRSVKGNDGPRRPAGPAGSSGDLYGSE